MRYSFLEAKITERGIKKAAISAAIGVTPKSFNNKLTGKVPLHGQKFKLSKSASFPIWIKTIYFNNKLYSSRNGLRAVCRWMTARH